MMLKRVLLVMFLTGIFSKPVEAQDQGFGLGVILGEPSGVSGKLWFGRTTSLNGALAWSVEGENSVHVHLDYVFHDFKLMQVEKGKLGLYYGAGGRVKFADDSTISLRIPVGLNYLFADAPVDLFFELVPMLDLAPSTDVNANGGIGVRYFFE